MKNRQKDKQLVVRVSQEDKRLIEGMAKREGKTLSEFILSRVWGEVADPVREEAPKIPESGTIQDKVAALRESISGVAQPMAPATQRRAFNLRKTAWYTLLESTDWGGYVVKDKDTGQIWLVTNGRAREHDTAEAATDALDAATA
jgi:uncharacterized protein (DUF1778 family)